MEEEDDFISTNGEHKLYNVYNASKNMNGDATYLWVHTKP